MHGTIVTAGAAPPPGLFGGPEDVRAFRDGVHGDLHRWLGSGRAALDGTRGYRFAVWAARARAVSVIGDFNGWAPGEHPLTRRSDDSGVWEGFVPGVPDGALYKYRVVSERGVALDRGDPFARCWEGAPGTASRTWSGTHRWTDQSWLRRRSAAAAPLCAYELELGAWRRVPEEGRRPLSYLELADRLPDYARAMGFTHVLLRPVLERALADPWGTAPTGLFAPSFRLGPPEDLMALVDRLHRAEVGVLLAWPLRHVGLEWHGLLEFDGAPLYERPGLWIDSGAGHVAGELDFSRPEVRSFALSSMLFWVDQYHLDGLVLEGLPRPAATGATEDSGLGLVLSELARRLRDAGHGSQVLVRGAGDPGRFRVAAAARWDADWAREALAFFCQAPAAQPDAQGALARADPGGEPGPRLLPLGWAEAEPAKASLPSRLPGDRGQRLAALRLLLGYQCACPGGKLLAMGLELGQWRPWEPEGSLDWHLLDEAGQAGVQRWVQDLNAAYRELAALADPGPASFRWLQPPDPESGVFAILRETADPRARVLVVGNVRPSAALGMRVGVPMTGAWAEILNSDAALYGGAGYGNLGSLTADPVAAGGHFQSLLLTLPALGVVFLRQVGGQGSEVVTP
jgi:1,4-alpha-glucan branching enzyme